MEAAAVYCAVANAHSTKIQAVVALLTLKPLRITAFVLPFCCLYVIFRVEVE